MSQSNNKANQPKFVPLWPRLKAIFSQLLAPTPQPVLEKPIVYEASPVSVIIPALNEAKRIAQVVKYALSDPRTGEVIVVDDSSIDDTAQLARDAGAIVMTSSMLGKGASMHDGLLIAKFENLAYLDGDLTGLQPNIISDLVAPLDNNEADFVKARFGRSSGRVTELMAKPMLKLFFPELSEFNQPLGGIIAARKSLLSQLQFEDGYGVDVALLIDAHLAGARLIQIDVGSLEHDSQSLYGLSLMAQEISQVIFERAKLAGRLSVDQIMSIYELESQNLTDIDRALTKLEGCTKLVLLDMDGTITATRYVVELAEAVGCSEQLDALLPPENIDVSTRDKEIAELFRFVHKSQFEKVAHSIEIREGVIQAVNQLRRKGYKVGVISDSYFVAAEIIRRRIFADFALAHSLSFEAGVCQGKLSINRAFMHENGCALHICCKSNALRYIFEQEPSLASAGVVVVGDNLNDLCLLEMAQFAFTIEPKNDILKTDNITEITHFNQLLDSITAQNYTIDPDIEHQAT